MWQTDKNTIRTKKVPFEQMVFFYFIGNSDFLNRKKKRMFVEHTLDKGKKGILD